MVPQGTTYLDPTPPPEKRRNDNSNESENSMNNAAKVTILGAVVPRTITGKNGAKTIYEQRAELETDAMRIGIEVECDGPNMGHPVGAVLHWDVVADLVPGRFGIELARKKTLRQPNVEAPKLTAGK